MPDLAPRDPHSRFVNWSGRVTSTPTAWLEPRTEAEVVDLVNRAAASGRRIRVVGAGHSFSAVGTPDDQAMTLDALSGLVSVGGASPQSPAGPASAISRRRWPRTD